MEDAFDQVSEYREADDLETLRGIQVPVDVHIIHASSQLMCKITLARPFATGVCMQSAAETKACSQHVVQCIVS